MPINVQSHVGERRVQLGDEKRHFCVPNSFYFASKALEAFIFF
jgi:hypothetical protein